MCQGLLLSKFMLFSISSLSRQQMSLKLRMALDKDQIEDGLCYDLRTIKAVSHKNLQTNKSSSMDYKVTPCRFSPLNNGLRIIFRPLSDNSFTGNLKQKRALLTGMHDLVYSNGEKPHKIYFKNYKYFISQDDFGYLGSFVFPHKF